MGGSEVAPRRSPRTRELSVLAKIISLCGVFFMGEQEKKLDKIYKLLDLWEKGVIPQEHKHEVHPDLPKESRERYLYFTLPPSLNFQRQSPSMWKSALETWNDPETNYLFFPEKLYTFSFPK